MNTVAKLFGLLCLHIVIISGTPSSFGYRYAVPVPASPYYAPSILKSPYYAPAPIPALAPAPLYSASTYKSESYATPSFSKSELRDDSGQYSLSYVTANGIRVTERSYLKPSAEGYVPVKEGTYSYTSPDGSPVSYGYRADENGYNVKGYPLPISPSAPIA